VLVANIVMAIFMISFAGFLAKLMYVPRSVLLPIILACCVIGSFALNNRGFDVAVMLGFGVVGYGMQRLKIPLAPFVIGFVLAPIAEKKLCEGLMLSGGSYEPLVSEPVSLIFLIISAAILILTIRKHFNEKQQSKILASTKTTD
jgi:putative tricarboxylic transport membrane protein